MDLGNCDVLMGQAGSVQLVDGSEQGGEGLTRRHVQAAGDDVGKTANRTPHTRTAGGCLPAGGSISEADVFCTAEGSQNEGPGKTQDGVHADLVGAAETGEILRSNVEIRMRPLVPAVLVPDSEARRLLAEAA